MALSREGAGGGDGGGDGNSAPRGPPARMDAPPMVPRFWVSRCRSKVYGWPHLEESQLLPTTSCCPRSCPTNAMRYAISRNLTSSSRPHSWRVRLRPQIAGNTRIPSLAAAEQPVLFIPRHPPHALPRCSTRPPLTPRRTNPWCISEG